MQADSTQDRSLEVRPADLDHPGIAALLATHTRRARGAARCRPGHALGTDALRDPAIEVWSLWRNDAPVAVGAIRRLSGEHGELKSMFVADGERGNGIGRLLLAHLIEAAPRLGFEEMVAYVLAGNDAMRALLDPSTWYSRPAPDLGQGASAFHLRLQRD